MGRVYNNVFRYQRSSSSTRRSRSSHYETAREITNFMRDILLDMAMLLLALWFGVNIVGITAVQIWFWTLGI